jgi:ribosomal subunit interface protein
MEVEFTARQGKISKALRTQAEEGMERIARILGKTARASITFSAQRHLQIVELTVQTRLQTIAAAGKADTVDAALRQAIDHAENQARRFRDRRMEVSACPKGRRCLRRLPVARPKARPAQPEEGAGGGEAGPRQGPGVDRRTFVSCPRDGGRAAYRKERRGDFDEGDDHRGGREGRGVPRPRPADLPHLGRRTVCAPPPPRRTDGTGGDSVVPFPQLHNRAPSDIVLPVPGPHECVPAEVVVSQVSKSNPHPSDEDLSPGTPRPGAPSFSANRKTNAGPSTRSPRRPRSG